MSGVAEGGSIWWYVRDSNHCGSKAQVSEEGCVVANVDEEGSLVFVRRDAVVLTERVQGAFRAKVGASSTGGVVHLGWAGCCEA